MKNLREKYNQWHSHRAETEDPSAAFNMPWNTFVRESIGDVKDKKVFEIACGRGHLSAHLAEQGADVVAADFSLGALQVLQSSGRSRGLKVVNADATRIGIKNDSIDIVVSCETIEHVLEPKKAIAEFFRILKPGGFLYLTFPSYLNFYGLYRVYLKALGRPYNSGDEIQPIENWLFSFQVARILASAGFKMIYRGGSGFYWLQPGRAPKNLYPHDPKMPLNRALKEFTLHSYIIAKK